MENEDEKVGIDALLTATDFACELANDVIASLADGKITLTDAPRFIDNLFSLPSVIGKVKQVDKEYLDLDAEEEVIWQARIAEKLNVTGATKEIINAVTKLIMKSAGMVKATLELVDVIKTSKLEPAK